METQLFYQNVEFTYFPPLPTLLLPFARHINLHLIIIFVRIWFLVHPLLCSVAECIVVLCSVVYCTASHRLGKHNKIFLTCC